MKKTRFRIKLSRIRAKVFATVCAMLALLFVLSAIFSSPALFYAFSFRTYQNLHSVAEKINSTSPGSITYLFELETISVNNNVSFEIVNAENIVSFSSLEHFSQSDVAAGTQPE